MKNRIPIDFLYIFFIFAIYGATVHFVSHENIYSVFGVSISGDLFDLYRDFEDAALFTFGIAFFSTVAWYVVGQWGPRSYRTSSSTWRSIWFSLLGVILVAATYANWHWLVENHAVKFLVGDYDWEICASMSFGAGAFFYWLATALFSPVGIKFIPPLSSLIRRGW